MRSTLLQQVCDSLLTISAFRQEKTRTLYLNLLESELGVGLAPERHQEPQLDLLSIILAYEQSSRDLTGLTRVARNLFPRMNSLAKTERLLVRWECEVDLLEILPDLDQDDVLAAAGAVADGRFRSDHPLVKITESIGWEHSERWGVAAMLAFADCLSHAMDGPQWDEDRTRLQAWVARVALRLGVNEAQLADARSYTARHYQELRPLINDVSILDSDDPEPDVRKTIIIESASPQIVAESAIRGGIPARNPNFTGRHEILDRLEVALLAERRASVLPEATLHGFGGVGKTQIAIEYVYRHVDDYQLIWWVPAEDQSTVRSSLSALAGRLGTPIGQTMDQTVRGVLDALAYTTELKWLLVYDNAAEPTSLDDLIPTSGGHVIVTSRDPGWAVTTSATLQVDVFTRAESKELLQRRRPEISDRDADRLAEQLGDLPLALEQAASWLITTMTSVDDYLKEFDRKATDLLDDGRPRQYPTTVLTLVGMALSRLREKSEGAAKLLELLAYLGPEPISTTLLWSGRSGDISEPLRSLLQERNDIARAVRELGRFGLAKVEIASKKLQVHRLIQRVLREELTEERREEAQRNARQLLAAANPGPPDDRSTWERHAEIYPHIGPAGLIDGEIDSRRTLLDQVRYLYNIGDLEGSRALAEEILLRWNRPVEEGGLGRNDGLTLLALRRHADTLRVMNEFAQAREETERAFEAMRDALGEDHEYTIGAANSLGADRRIAGRFEEAQALDEQYLQICQDNLGEGDPATIRALNSVALDHYVLGDYQSAYESDVESARQARIALGEGDALTYFALSMQARDLNGLGRYAEALQLQQRVLPAHIELLGPYHGAVLLAQNHEAAALRKVGRLDEALARSRENYRSSSTRFGEKHQFTLISTVTYANALRTIGDFANAFSLSTTALNGFTDLYGAEYPLTLAAAVDTAIVHRAQGNDMDARELDERTLEIMRRVLPSNHPYLLSLLSNYAIDLVRAHQLADARTLTQQVLEAATVRRGALHPYTLHAATNHALLLIDLGEKKEGTALLADNIAALERVLSKNHPEVEGARRHRRAECDIDSSTV
ncbi:FxSxx-COOH system tetratricopeptide repeat protein [Hamadaea tsunoensis]|uniref:FxSxx-COOH system tetratricopeptide repeat protein n=1 Tax=Hamadaea tsunoensis TaxID=53368 RepID=UPI000480E897|nr:FxSxx-COOH system tetratricopeptide repeat protein [Hamadaea tsunoensis]